MTIVLIGSYSDPLGPRNHNKNTTSVHYRRLALQRIRAMYIAAFVLVMMKILIFLEPSKMQHRSRQDNTCTYIQSYRLDVSRTLIDLE